MSLKILVVDDSATARALLKAYIPKDISITMYEADNYQQALEYATKHNPAICIMDYNMPEKTGIEIAEAIQKKGIKAKFVLMTANTQQSVLQKAEKLGFSAVVEKPISAEIIKKTIEELI